MDIVVGNYLDVILSPRERIQVQPWQWCVPGNEGYIPIIISSERFSCHAPQQGNKWEPPPSECNSLQFVAAVLRPWTSLAPNNASSILVQCPLVSNGFTATNCIFYNENKRLTSASDKPQLTWKISPKILILIAGPQTATKVQGYKG